MLSARRLRALLVHSTLIAFASLWFPAAMAASVTGSASTSTSTYNVSSYGTLDWAHWGNGGVPGIVQRAGGTGGTVVTGYEVVGAGTVTTTTTGRRSMSWTGGAPVASSSSNENGVAVSGAGNGFRIVVPADAQTRTIRVNVGGASGVGATFRAHLSDGSASDYVNTVAYTTSLFARMYTITYRADGPGRTLELTWVIDSGAGNAYLHAAGAPTFTYQNFAPTIGAPAAVSLEVGSPAVVAVSGADVNGDLLTYSATGLPAGLTLNPSTGVITGSPTSAGSNVATVTVSDPGGLFASASIDFTVGGASNTGPSAASGSFTTAFNTPVTFTPTWVDPDVGDSWTVAVLSQPANGVATVSGTQVTYTPNAGYVGPDSFNFRVIDSQSAFTDGVASGTVTSVTPAQVVSVTATQGTLVGAVNLVWPSAANATSYDVRRGTSASDPSPILLGNVSVTNYSDTTPPAPGVQYYYSVVSRNSSSTGTASPSSMGFADTPPTGVSGAFSATLETPIQVTPSFTDPDAGDTPTFAIVTQPANGTATVAGSVITYTPASGFVGSDSFVLSVTDRAGASASGTVSGTVTALAPSPVDSVSATQGTLVGSVQVTWPAASNARTYRVYRGSSASDPSPVELATVGSLSYSDGTAAPGAQYFYSVQSLTIGQQATRSPAVLGFADTPPNGASAAISTPVDTPSTVVPVFNDPDPGDTFTVAIVTQPSNGTASASSGQITYQPNPGFTGADSFTFAVTDRAGASVVGTASASVYVLVPDAVAGLSATTASRVNSVDISWSASLNATSYAIHRSASQSDPSPPLLQTVTALSYTDNSALPGERWYYFVKGVNAHATGPLTSGVLGYADTPPANLAASFSTLQDQIVMVVPTWDDPDPSELFTVTVVTPPSNGSAVVVNNQVRYTPQAGYVGSEAFQISVRDRAGVSTSGFVTGTVNPGIPQSPLDFVVSQGTLIGGVKLDWTSSLGAINYLVLRAETPNSASPNTIATIDGNTFTDATATAGATYYYRIRPVGASGVGAPSQEVSGYADTPPTAASATAVTVFGVPIDFGATVNDPDPLDEHVYTILTVPSNGTLTLNPDRDRFTYTPNAGWSGQDTFTFTATDVAGASINGTGTVSVGCPAPTLAALNVSQPKLFAGSGFKVASTYGNTGCPTSLSAVFEVRAGTTLVLSSNQPSLPGVVSAPVEFTVDSLAAGSYVLSIKVTDSTTGTSKTSTMNLAVANYRMPSFTATSSLFAGLDTATIAVGTSTDCTLTNDRSAAIADHRLCYYEVLPLPPGLSFDTQASLPTWSGKVSSAGVFSPALSIFQFDDFGTAKLLGSITRTMTVQEVTTMTFSSPASVTAAQYMEEAVVTVSQVDGHPCQLTTDRTVALASAAQGNRACYLEFQTISPYQTLLATGIKSPFLSAGTSSVNWTVSTFDTAGYQIPVSTGSTDVQVVPPDLSFAASPGTTIPIATITQASIRLEQTGTVPCVLTLTDTVANVPGVTKPCLVEWKTVPEGLAQSPTSATPLLEGVFKVSGQQPIEFDVSYYDVSGTKRVLWTAATPVYVEPPPMPEIVLRSGRMVGTGGAEIYSVPVTGGMVANLLVDVTKWPVDVSVKWSDEPMARTYRVSPTRGSQIIDATPASLWSRRQATIRLFLRDSPSLYVEKTIEVVSVPVVGVTLDLDALGATVPDNAPTPLSARVYTRSAVGPLYSADTIGQWSVQFGTKDSTGRFVPLGDPVLTDANGVAPGSISPFGLTVLRAVAVARPVSPYPDVELLPLTSPLRAATVVKGTPVEGTVEIRGLAEGPAPLVGIFRVAFATRSDLLANLGVTWHLSSDNGSTWTPLDVSGIQIITRLGEGKYLIKAGLTNRNTLETSETLPVEVAVWAVPKITFTGPRFAFPGTTMDVNMILTHPNGSPVQSATVEWTVEKRVVLSAGATPPPPLATGATQAIQFTATEPGLYMVKARARMNSSNPDNIRAWGLAQYQVTYGAPERPYSLITAPTRAEVGKQYPFAVSVRTRFDISATNLRIEGRWTLPDGTVVPSLEAVNYTPTDADLAKSAYMTFKHESWVAGYEDTTLTTSTKSIPIWKYLWPNWKMITSVATPVAPAGARFTVLPDNLTLLPTLEGLTYTWTLPATMRSLSVPGSRLDSVVDYGGTHPLSVVISDARGNSTQLDSTVTVSDPAPYTMDVVVTKQSKWSHAPLQVAVTPRVTGGHPLDAIIEWKYLVNGTPLDLANKSVASISLPDSATYDIEVRAASKMGATASKAVTVNVPANVPPTCTMTATPSLNRLFVAVLLSCRDPDGAIVRYDWAVNGSSQSFGAGAKWTYTVPTGTTFPITFTADVTDDGGAKVTVTAVAN